MELNNEKISKLVRESKKSTSHHEETHINQEIENLINNNNNIIKRVGRNIHTLQPLIKTACEKFDESDERHIKTSFSAFTQTFQARVKNFQDCQKVHKENMIKTVKRQIKIINPDIKNESDIDDIVRNPEQLQRAIQGKIFGQAHFSVVTAVEDIKEKYDDIVTLEQNIAQITEILKDLAAVVHENGLMVNSIKDGVSKAKNWTKKGEENLVKAKDYNEDAKKKKKWVCMCCCMAALVLGAPTLLTTLTNLKVI